MPAFGRFVVRQVCAAANQKLFKVLRHDDDMPGASRAADHQLCVLLRDSGRALPHRALGHPADHRDIQCNIRMPRLVHKGYVV
jgi:hypothetical protein